MDAIACVTQILEEAGNEIEEKDDHRVVFLSRSMKTRVCMIVADGFAHARLLVIIAFQPIDSESLERIHRHIAEAENDISFIGRIEQITDETCWRIDFTLSSNFDANQEMLECVFTYAHDDLSRIDLILGLEDMDWSSEAIRKCVSEVGLVHGNA
jgi:hypothetical protein